MQPKVRTYGKKLGNPHIHFNNYNQKIIRLVDQNCFSEILLYAELKKSIMLSSYRSSTTCLLIMICIVWSILGGFTNSAELSLVWFKHRWCHGFTGFIMELLFSLLNLSDSHVWIFICICFYSRHLELIFLDQMGLHRLLFQDR